MKYFYLGSGFVMSCCLVIIGIISYSKPDELLSPIISLPDQPSSTLPQNSLLVYGFLPYWNLDTLNPNHTNNDVIVYSGITLSEIGRATKDNGLSNLDRQSFSRLKKFIYTNNQKLHLSFTMFSTKDIEAMLTSDAARNEAITTIIAITKKHNANGINLDFEPNTPVDTVVPKLFTQFVEELRASLQNQSLDQEITIDIFGKQHPSSLWEISELQDKVSAFVLMAYDYHHKNSIKAGPVAPIYGASKNSWSGDVSESLWLLRQKIDQDKIILGVPFYGYEWRVIGDEIGSSTYPNSGKTATYDQVSRLLENQNITPIWDNDALSPWITLSSDGSKRQIYYENQQSITHKLSLAKQAGLRGVAIWALGYEGEESDLWIPFEDIMDSN